MMEGVAGQHLTRSGRHKEAATDGLDGSARSDNGPAASSIDNKSTRPCKN